MNRASTHFSLAGHPAIFFHRNKHQLVDPLAVEILEDRHKAGLAPSEVQTRDLLKLPRIKRIQIKADKVKSGSVITIECKDAGRQPMGGNKGISPRLRSLRE